MVHRKKKQLGLLEEDAPGDEGTADYGHRIVSPTTRKMDNIPEAENEDLDINIAAKDHGRNAV